MLLHKEGINRNFQAIDIIAFYGARKYYKKILKYHV